jgi:hypothetical protein
MRIGLLWARQYAGLYSNSSFDDLYSFIGHNNGNLAFVYAISQHLTGSVTYYPWHTSPAKLRAEVDLIVIPCANQLGGHTDLGGLAENLKEANVPVVAIGLGAQSKNEDEDVSLKPGTLEWLKTIASLRANDAANIYVRGPYTEGQVKKLGVDAVVMGGCPSFFINKNPDLGIRIARNFSGLPKALCVAGAHQSWANVADAEQQLVSMISDSYYPGSYVPQSMGDMIKISRNEFDSIDPAVLERIRLFVAPHLSMEMFKEWCRRFARSFYDVPAWMDHLRNFDLTVGARYHGVALALQAEKMGLTITIDTRTKELCEQTGVPNVSADEIRGVVTRKRLYERLKSFDGQKYDEFRSMKANIYVDFLIGNGIKPADYLLSIAGR